MSGVVHATLVSSDGVETPVQGRPGQTLMQVAVAQGAPGIVGECGGAAMCATCHVYVDPLFIERLAPLQDFESELLDCAVAERRPNSRLACQIVLDSQLDGLVAHTPLAQTA